MMNKKITASEFSRLVRAANRPANEVGRELGHRGFEIEGIDQYKISTPQKTIYEQQLSHKGFFQRLKESVTSAPERAKLSFGSEDVRREREEVSKGFDLADLPGDVADILGRVPAFGGMLLGSAVGGVLGVGAGGIGAVPGSIVGAGVGAGVGEAGSQAIGDILGVRTPEPIEQAKEIGKEAAIAVAAELGGGIITRVGGKLLKPFTGLFDKEISDLAVKKGIELPTSAISESNIVRIGETVTSKGFFGANVERIVNKANEQILKAADDIVQKIGGSDDLMAAGRAIADGANKFRDIWINTKNTLYKKANELVKARPKKEFINIDETVKVLDEILEAKESAGVILGDNIVTKRLMTIRDNLTGKFSIKNVSDAIRELNNMTKFGTRLVSTGDEAALKKVAATLSSDLDNHIKLVDPALGAALDKADVVYKNGIEVLESKVGGNIAKLMDSPEKILNAILRPGAESDAKRLMQIISKGEGGTQRLRNIQAAFARKLISDSVSPKTGLIMGGRFSSNLKKFSTVIDIMFDKKIVDALKDVSKLAIAMDKSQVVAQGSSTAFNSKLMGVIASLVTGNFPAATSIIGGDVVLNQIFTTKLGRKWLTEGVADTLPQWLKAGVPITIRGGLEATGQAISQ